MIIGVATLLAAHRYLSKPVDEAIPDPTP
jgi:hypothetical protein